MLLCRTQLGLPKQPPPRLRKLICSFPTPIVFPTIPFITILLGECRSLPDAKRIHQQVLVHGLMDMACDVVGMYLACNSPLHASKVLRQLPLSSRDVRCWNLFIRHSVHLGLLDEVLHHWRWMRSLGWRPDEYTFPLVLKACGELPSLRRGTWVHAAVFVHGFEWNVYVCNAAVAMYGRCGALEDARRMFHELSHKGIGDVISWNSIVAAYMQNGDSVAALKIFDKMAGDVQLRPDVVSLCNVLPACASPRGRQIHGYAFRNDLSGDLFLCNALVSMYANAGKMDEADKVFSQMKVKDVVSWNAMVSGYSQVGRFDDVLRLFEKMKAVDIDLDVVTWTAVIAGYAQRGYGYEALDVFRQMQLCGLEPNVVTLVTLLSGCASAGAGALLQGREIHCYSIKCVLYLDESDKGDYMMVYNGLISMYAKCRNIRVACTMFDLISADDRDVVTWTSMIGGYAQHGEPNDALGLFCQMLRQTNSMRPNAYTISCALMACSQLAALRSGRQIHAHVIRNQYESEILFVSNCLIDMYGKSGDVDAARTVFDNMHRRNDVSWTSLVTVYGMHGCGEEALEIFEESRRAGLVPDGVSFVVVLYACSHSGLVDQGIKYFNNMSKEFGVVAGLEHYTCMVDLLARAGRMDEAMKLVEDMPMRPSPVIWATLLSACRIHANVELAEYAADQLQQLESGNDATYALLSNIYANARRWKDVARIRSLMKYSGINKRPGCSWVQGKDGTATFFVGDKSHPLSKQIYELLADLIQRIKVMGYVPDVRFALHDVNDEEKGDLLVEHSEKLALAYGILTSFPGAPIRITKNLRVCGDCHSAITYISRIIDHEIIIRDCSRFHHFKNGSCSCKGYW